MFYSAESGRILRALIVECLRHADHVAHGRSDREYRKTMRMRS